MNFKVYVYQFIAVLTISMSSWLALSYYLDEFGHYGDCSPKEIRIAEKVSKLLFSAGCSIDSYDSYIIGTSASSLNVDSSKLISGNFYNFSVNAGAVSDSSAILEVPLNKDQEIKNIIIGIIPPYTNAPLVKISAPNGFKLLMSRLSIEVALRRWFGSYTENVFKGSWYGDTSSDPLNLASSSSERIKSDLASTTRGNLDNYFKINKEQFNELKNLLETAQAQKINVVGYFHEYPKGVNDIPRFTLLYQEYKDQINILFHSNGFITIDPGKLSILDSNNNENYFNMHHLSSLGAKKVFNYLDTKVIETSTATK